MVIIMLDEMLRPECILSTILLHIIIDVVRIASKIDLLLRYMVMVYVKDFISSLLISLVSGRPLALEFVFPSSPRSMRLESFFLWGGISGSADVLRIDRGGGREGAASDYKEPRPC